MKSYLLIFFSSLAVFGVSVEPLERSPEGEGEVISLTCPLDGANLVKYPLNIEMKVQGFSLGVITQGEKKNQFRGDPRGQTVHLFIDNKPYVDISSLSPYEVKALLPRGAHLVRVLLCRSFGESLKGAQAFDYALFKVSDRKAKLPLEFDRKAPLLTYNEPQGTYRSGPILLDFYLSNCTLSPEGYKVRLRVDGKETKRLTKWVPYSLQGLAKGPHKIQLTLMDKTGKEVRGEFNDIEREIFVK